MNEIKGLNRHMTKKQNWQKILQVTNLEKIRISFLNCFRHSWINYENIKSSKTES